MNFLTSIYVGATLVGGVGASIVWRRRQVEGGRPLALMLLAAAFWAFCDALELQATSVDAKRTISQVQYLGVVLAAPFFFHAAFALSRRESRLTTPILWAIWTVPLCTLAVAWTSKWHMWLWRAITIVGDGSNRGIYHYGWWFWILTTHHYVLLSMGTLVLLSGARRVTRPFRGPLVLVVLAVLLPWLGNIAYVFKLGPWPGLNWLSVSISISGMLLGWSVLRGGLFDLLPRAREALVDHMTDSVIVLDRFDRILFFNRAARNMLELGEATCYLPEAIRLGHLENPLLESGQCEVLFEGHEGARWLEVRANPIRDRWGDVAGQVVVVHDISAHKRAEKERQRLEAQLRQAQKLEALGTLAGGIAHEFNNILGIIIGNIDLARQDVDAGHPAQESLAEMSKASHRARDLVQQILAFSRQRADAPKLIELSTVVDESVRLLSATLPTAVEIHTHVDTACPEVRADGTEVHEAIMNLGANAWQAMEEDGGRLDISVETVEVDAELASANADLRPGRYVRLSVIDNGKGMDASTLARIFDPFFTTKAPGKGTGLGLAVVYGIIKNHEGAITVDSQPGQGTSVHLYFPAVEAKTETPCGGDLMLPRGSGQRILYLDDEPSLVRLAKQTLEGLGYEVSAFTQPAQALAVFRANPARFNLVVTDFNMPGISGTQVAAELLSLRPDLKVMLTSGSISTDVQATVDTLGIHQVMFKPYTTRQMAQAVSRLLLDGRRT
jgi:signal transduction histidine kinase/CheY-like chemotaxis protein